MSRSTLLAMSIFKVTSKIPTEGLTSSDSSLMLNESLLLMGKSAQGLLSTLQDEMPIADRVVYSLNRKKIATVSQKNKEYHVFLINHNLQERDIDIEENELKLIIAQSMLGLEPGNSLDSAIESQISTEFSKSSARKYGAYQSSLNKGLRAEYISESTGSILHRLFNLTKSLPHFIADTFILSEEETTQVAQKHFNRQKMLEKLVATALMESNNIDDIDESITFLVNKLRQIDLEEDCINQRDSLLKGKPEKPLVFSEIDDDLIVNEFSKPMRLG